MTRTASFGLKLAAAVSLAAFWPEWARLAAVAIKSAGGWL